MECENRCVCCGEVIPEGTQLCWMCWMLGGELPPQHTQQANKRDIKHRIGKSICGFIKRLYDRL